MAALIGGIPAQSVSTSQLVGSQPTRRSSADGGGVVIINNVLHSEEWIEMVRRNKLGEYAAGYVDDLYGAFAGVMG